MQGGIFLTTKDVMILLGCGHYNTANRLRLSIKDAIGKKSKYITIMEYCKYEELDFEYVWNVLRGKK